MTALALVLVVGIAAGCSTRKNADKNNGQMLFIEKCGSCHTMARPGTQGQVAPNLDEAFAQARIDGMDADTVAGVVEQQIAAPRRQPDGAPATLTMPANLVTGQDAKDVAAYVAQWAGKPGVRVAPQGQPVLPVNADPGAKTFVARGCGACHILEAAGTEGNIGPNLNDSIKGQSKAFIRQSILEPTAYIEPGYSAGQMPQNYKQELSNREVEDLTNLIYNSVHNQRAGPPG